MVGYSPTGYIFLNPETGKLFESRNVRFNEKYVYGDRFKLDSIAHWPISTDEINLNDWFKPEKDLNNTNESSNDRELLTTEGENKKKEGDRLKENY